MSVTILHDEHAFHQARPRWDALAASAGVGLFLSHRWLSAWWRAFRGVDQLWVVVVEDGEALLGAWPLYLRAVRSSALGVRELKVIGDLGGAQRSILCQPGAESVVAESFVSALSDEHGWDLLDTPIFHREVAEHMERALAGRPLSLDRTELVGRPFVDLPAEREWDEFARTRGLERTGAGLTYERVAPDQARARLADLLRLNRREWAARESSSPAADPEVVLFLSELMPELVLEGSARVGILSRPDGAVVGAEVVVVDGWRQVQLMRGVDPELSHAGGLEALTTASLREAVRAGARRIEFSDEDTPIHLSHSDVQRLRLWSGTTAGRLHRRVSSIRDVVRTAEARVEGQSMKATARAVQALDRLRGRAPDVVQRAVARVAASATLQLYRGELFIRAPRADKDLQISLFPNEAFEALDASQRTALVSRLDLQESYCRQKWSRGDMVVLARDSGGLPVGIVWCARTPVYVPDIGREVRPLVGECYIHDVFVHPDERGRQVAPQMLESLARELRARDVYRAWALIERTNAASTRAFEKAAYASIADVTYGRVGLASRLIIEPPDPEAKAFLGM